MKGANEIVAKNIREMRNKLNLTQKQLADMIGYSMKTVSKWESGLGIPPSVVLPDLATALKTDINHLFQGIGEPLYYLGIDGGGTKTDFVLADKSGNIVNHITLGACNPADVGEKETYRVLRDGIYQVCDQVSLSQISVFAGIAGGGTEYYSRRIGKFLNDFHFSSVDNGSDATNAIALGLKDRDGIVVILGTGSVAFTKSSGKISRTGGYGYLFGDKGSGFSIGRDILLAIMKEEDGRGESTVLRDYVLRDGKTKTVSERIPEFYSGSKRLLASYAPLAFEAWENGDMVATHILEDNMQEVARLIIDAGNKMLRQREIPVVFFGSIAKQTNIIIPMIQKFLEKESPKQIKYQLTVCEKPVYIGALLMAGMKEKEDESDAENRETK